jgi:2-phospho-L-lactate guanylyltransferase
VTAKTGVVVPIRAFALGKARLAPHLDDDARAALSRTWADRVADAAAGHDTVIVSSDDEVRRWARRRGLGLVDDPGSLDAAATAGRARLRAGGCVRVVVAHADLPLACTLDGVARDAGLPVVTIVPCHRDDGTPVLSVPAHADFRFSYGVGSFRRHAAEARRIGLGLRVVRDPALSFDVDTPEDLRDLMRREARRAPARPASHAPA